MCGGCGCVSAHVFAGGCMCMWVGVCVCVYVDVEPLFLLKGLRINTDSNTVLTKFFGP